MSTWPNWGASGGPCGGWMNKVRIVKPVRPPRSDSSQQASTKAGVVQYIFADRARASHRWCRLNSNVMPHTKHLARAPSRIGRQSRRTEDKTPAAVATTKKSCARRRLPSVVPSSKKSELRAATPARTTIKLGTIPHVNLKAASAKDSAVDMNELSSCRHCLKVWVYAVGIHRASHSEPLGRNASRSGGVTPLLCRQPRRGSFRSGPSEKTTSPHLARVRHNPSLKRSANGMPPAPGRRYAVHFRHPGAGVLPSSPA